MAEVLAVPLLLVLLGAVVLILAETHGRSGPTAAVAFLLGGPVLGVVLIIPLGFQRSEHPSPPGAHDFYGLSPLAYATVMFFVGLAAAACASAVYAAASEDRYPAMDLDPVERPPLPVPSAALHALGLAPWASLDDVELAFRARQAELEGLDANDAQLRRLQATYHRAKRYVERRPTASARSLASAD